MSNDAFAEFGIRPALALLVAGAFADGAGALSGSVLSADGESIAVAEIRVICGTEVVGTFSAVNGAFAVDGRSPDPSCRLDVSAPGHVALSVPVGEFVADGRVLRLAAIRPSPELEELVVVADRISRPFAALYMPALAVFSNPSARADPLMAIATAPSSSTVGESSALRLRGSPAGTVGLFVGEVPVYERIRGVDMDANSVEPSIFGSTPYDIEIYPNNPPLYLSNAGMAAARLMPSASAGDSLALMTTGIGGTHAFGRGSVAGRIAGSWSNMGAMLALNPALKGTVGHSRSTSANLQLGAATGRWGEVRAFAHVDDENGSYPLTLLSSQGVWRNERRRTLATVSLQRGFGLATLKLSAGLARSDGGGSFRSWRFASTNDYRFLSLDASAEAHGGRIHYRTGLVAENARLDHRGIAERFELLWHAAFPPNHAMRRVRRPVHGGVYGFGTWRVSARTLLMAGARRHFGDAMAGKHSWQVGLTRENARRSGKIIIAVGQYQALRMPRSTEWLPPVPFRSRQVAVDWQVSKGAADLAAGIFAACVKEPNRESALHGVELSMRWQIVAPLTARSSAMRVWRTVVSDGYGFRGEGDAELLFRGGFDLALRRVVLTLNYVRGDGLRYTEVVGRTRSPVDGALYFPVFSRERHGAELRPYRRLDVSAVFPVRIGRVDANALLAASNALDRRNPRAKAYSADFSASYDVHYPPRAFVAGLIFVR